MDAKHTKGPWRIVAREVLDDGSIYPAHVVGDGDIEVCPLEATSVADLAIKYGGIWNIDHEKDGDARLIAAAPELVEALKTLAEHAKRSIDDSGGCDHSVGICLCEEIRALDAASAVLSKALGDK